MSNLSDLEAALIELQIVSRIYSIPNSREVMDFMVFLVTRNPKVKQCWVGVRKVFEMTEIDMIYLQELDDFVESLSNSSGVKNENYD